MSSRSLARAAICFVRIKSSSDGTFTRTPSATIIGRRLLQSMSNSTGSPPAIGTERHLRWHPSGKFLTLVYNAGENLNLLLLPVDGAAPRTIGNLGKGDLGSFAWSNDGRQLIYSVTTETQDAVLLSDF